MMSSAPQSQSLPPSAEDEALKRNTDCVYFLASPLTCKKGSECEYRHSDIARVNPRDCWYWLHGNCLNPKCAFRHPPLDGLVGEQTPASTGSSLPFSQTVTVPTQHVPNIAVKQPAPCIFFQKGLCLKGDWCPFLHGSNSIGNKASSVPGTESAADPATFKKAFGGPEKSVQEKVVPVAKPIKDFAQVKPSHVVEPAPLRNEYTISRRLSVSGTEFPSQTSALPASNGNPASWSNHVQQSHMLDEPESMNSKDAEEVSREPSPGFDVLVDDEGRDSEYYPAEDRYGMPTEHEARNDYDIGHSTDYNTIAGVDDERYQDRLGYEAHDHRNGRYAWEQLRASSERMLGGSYHERRPNARHDAVGQVDELDLRHRLAKNKKPNGLRSVISHDHVRDIHARDRSYHGLNKDEQYMFPHDNSVGSRLRGRIRLPQRSLSPNNRDMNGGDGRGRISPARAGLSSQQSRISDRIKRRVEDDFSYGGKNHRGPHVRRDNAGENNAANFAGPKSLAELKNRKNVEPSGQHATDQRSVGKRKHLMHDGHQENCNDLSFEGPKPLEQILKRKRGETVGAINGNSSSDNKGVVEDNNKEATKDMSNNETITGIANNEEVAKSLLVQKAEVDEVENGVLVEDGAHIESEAYEQRDGEPEYGQVGGQEFEAYDCENGDAEGEYLDDEDDDDDDEFAKKMGVMHS